MNKYKKRIFDIIQIGNREDFPSRTFDIVIVIVIALNLFVTLFDTFESSAKYASVLSVIELITIIIFTIEFILRLWTSEYLYPSKKEIFAPVLFFFSFYGLVDFLSFFPYYLPIFFPAGAVAFRIFRVIRIFRLFRINATYDAFNLIIDVLKEKRNQLFSSMCMILVFMVAASMCMYSIEHDAQPEAFSNAFSGIWWATSTLLTIGYGDVYPITTLGKMLAIVIGFLGVGMVAIPTGIISAGFIEQYSKIHSGGFIDDKKNNFITPCITEDHPWNGMHVDEIIMPPNCELVCVYRGEKKISIKNHSVLKAGDEMVILCK